MSTSHPASPPPGATSSGRSVPLRNAMLAGAGFAVAALGVAGVLTLLPPPAGEPDAASVAPRASLSANESLVEPGAPVAAPAKPAPRRESSARPRALPICADCGVVVSVRSVQKKGDGTGLGAVAGGVVGGALGNQMGKGSGRSAMTVLGAVGGGFAGHEIEKRARSEVVYEVRVRMDDGRMRTLQQRNAPAVGTRVELEGSVLKPIGTRADNGA